MTTITEKQGTTASLINDIATAALALVDWSDGDTYVTNDQTTNAWSDNGRVLHHTPSGQYVLLHIADRFADIDEGNQGPNVRGIRVCTSNDWDAVNHHPAGLTEVHSDDPYNADVGFNGNASFTYTAWNTDNNNWSESIGNGVWYFQERTGDTMTQATDTVTYFASVGASWLNIAAWNTTDGTTGGAAYLTWEYVDNKFWADGADPWASYSQTSVSEGGREIRIGMYGYKYWQQEQAPDINHPYNAAGFDRGAWGIVNPDSADDTFFFRRPVLYQTNAKKIPVAYIEDAISNDTDEGGAHGDTITHGGVTYRVFRQSGAGQGITHSVGLRYE